MTSPKFIIGMVLLFTNQIFGWGGIFLFSYLAKKTGKKFYYIIGGAVYAFSWGMLALGVYLAGPEGIRIVRKYIPDWLSIAVLIVVVILLVVPKISRGSQFEKTIKNSIEK